MLRDAVGEGRTVLEAAREQIASKDRKQQTRVIKRIWGNMFGSILVRNNTRASARALSVKVVAVMSYSPVPIHRAASNFAQKRSNSISIVSRRSAGNKMYLMLVRVSGIEGESVCVCVCGDEKK
jgi:hypothetical protein